MQYQHSFVRKYQVWTTYLFLFIGPFMILSCTRESVAPSSPNERVQNQFPLVIDTPAARVGLRHEYIPRSNRHPNSTDDMVSLGTTGKCWKVWLHKNGGGELIFNKDASVTLGDSDESTMLSENSPDVFTQTIISSAVLGQTLGEIPIALANYLRVNNSHSDKCARLMARDFVTYGAIEVEGAMADAGLLIAKIELSVVGRKELEEALKETNKSAGN